MKNYSDFAINKSFFLNLAKQLWAASLRRTLVLFVNMAAFIMQLKNSYNAMVNSMVKAVVGLPVSMVGVTTNHFKKAFILQLLLLPFICMAQSTTLTLEEAVKIAIENNYGVVISKNQIEIGKLNNTWGNAGALPVISATGNKTLATNNIQQKLSNGTNINTNGASVNNMNAGLAVSWRFFDGMKMFATKKRLEELQKMGELNFRKMVNETAYDVIVTYYLIVSLKEQTKATNDMIDLYKERLKIADARFTIGTGNKPDVLQAQVDLNEQQSSLLRIDNNINISKTNLNTILARDPAIAFETADSFLLSAPPDFLTLQQKITQQNPDMMLAQSNLAVLMQSKKELYSLGLPSATLNTNYNFIRNKSAAGFTLLNQTYGPSASIGISIPIFNGGVAKQQLKVADINIKNQTIANEQLKNQLLGTFTNAYLNYNNGLKLAEMEQKNLLLVKENNFINIERFKKFSITSVELRQGQIYYTDAQARLINAQYQAKIAEAEMLLLAGEIK
jgi:outer membrane protein TolC